MRQWWDRSTPANRRRIHRRRSSRTSHARCLRIELLEDRRVLAALVVTSPDDNTTNDGLVTLREAIKAANEDTVADAIEGTQTGSGVDTIQFSAGLNGA